MFTKTTNLKGTLPLIATLTYFGYFLLDKIHHTTYDNAFRMEVPLDFSIYLLGGQRVTNHENLYDGTIIDPWPFTYPPFAGWLFSLWDGASFESATVVWHAISFAALTTVILMVVRSLKIKITPWTTLAAIGTAFALLALDPIQGTFFFGQINIVLMLLVAADFLPGKHRLPGIGTGLAAGIKLTPALFGVLFLLQKRWWAAAGCFATFLATVGIGYLTVEDAHVYWAEKITDSTRIGDHDHPAAQSIKSVMIREFGTDSTTTWVLLVVVVCAVVFAGAWFLLRTQQEALAVGTVGLAACLISPFSWFHHWVWFAMIFAVVLFGGMRALQLGVESLFSGPWAHSVVRVLSQFVFIVPVLVCMWLGHWIVTAPVHGGETPTYSVFFPSMQEQHGWLFTVFGASVMVAVCVWGVVSWLWYRSSRREVVVCELGDGEEIVFG